MSWTLGSDVPLAMFLKPLKDPNMYSVSSVTYNSTDLSREVAVWPLFCLLSSLSCVVVLHNHVPKLFLFVKPILFKKLFSTYFLCQGRDCGPLPRRLRGRRPSWHRWVAPPRWASLPQVFRCSLFRLLSGKIPWSGARVRQRTGWLFHPSPFTSRI